MSRSEGNATDAFKRLDGAVDQALAQVRNLRARVKAVESRNGELEALMARFESGADSPGDYMKRMRSLETENGDLRDRLAKGRDAVDRLLARVRFLEEQR